MVSNRWLTGLFAQATLASAFSFGFSISSSPSSGSGRRLEFFKSGNSRAQAIDTYAANARTAIEVLNTDWYNTQTGIWDNAWWNSGNILTILADFAILRTDDANELNLGGYMRHTLIQAQKTSVMTSKSTDAMGMTASVYCLDWDQGCMVKRDMLAKRGFDDFLNEYFDDQGWWTLGLIRAYDASGDQDYLDAAVRIVQDMMATGLGGPCGGGIYWNRDRKYVNAITNELYLSVLASLANRIPGERERYLELAKAQWQWFDKSGMINSDNLINDGLTDGCKNNKLSTWSYNQGVILGGLAELYKATGDEELLRRGHLIAKAAIKHLSNEDGVLVETDKCELRSGNCGSDGQQFKGIFVRNLRYFNEVAPDAQYRAFIRTNADTIWAKNRNDKNQMGVSWPGPVVAYSGNSHSSALDVIVAAIAVV